MLLRAIEGKGRLLSLSRVMGAKIGQKRKICQDWLSNCGSIPIHQPTLVCFLLQAPISSKRKPRPECRRFPGPPQRLSRISLRDSGRMASLSFILSATNPRSLRMTKEQLGERPAWVKVVEKCGRSQPACAIRTRPMVPIENWKRVGANG